MSSQGSPKTFTRSEVIEHDKSESLWLVVHNKVYDVTNFMVEHPGGEEILLEMAGKDATIAFEENGHSVDARALMGNYYVGNIEASEVHEDEKARLFPVAIQDKDTNGSNLGVILVVLIIAILSYILLSKSS
ncbi:Cytochrome b5 [Trichoplax sp. H2]|nr:Cytochrome b5 [Trichoplax sp. H2]|eukprot:RDD37388.1 Cytochrome b5 [Trichoplax sp. H2]